jgi:hypothetical protein
MGYGNQNTDGNKKSNFQWQYGMIKVLNKILVAIQGTPATSPNKKAETLRVTSSTGAVTVPTYGIAFFNAGSVTAEVAGSNLLPGESVSFSAESEGQLAGIDYSADVTGSNTGDLFISYVVAI